VGKSATIIALCTTLKCQAESKTTHGQRHSATTATPTTNCNYGADNGNNESYHLDCKNYAMQLQSPPLSHDHGDNYGTTTTMSTTSTTTTTTTMAMATTANTTHTTQTIKHTHQQQQVWRHATVRRQRHAPQRLRPPHIQHTYLLRVTDYSCSCGLWCRCSGCHEC